VDDRRDSDEDIDKGHRGFSKYSKTRPNRHSYKRIKFCLKIYVITFNGDFSIE